MAKTTTTSKSAGKAAAAKATTTKSAPAKKPAAAKAPAQPPMRAFVWNELMTTDIKGAKKFYGEVFGWTHQDMSFADPMVPAKQGEPGYTIWSLGADDKTGQGGGMQMDGEGFKGVPPHWLAYVAVDDADATVEKVKRAGGTVLMGPMDIKGVGRIYLIKDPQGAVLGIGKFMPMGEDCA
jgi:predicted enzyme related to lactoylglutathione lyase